MASKLGMPLVAMGFGFDRPWRLKSWDRFAIPRPMSRARAIPSPEIFVPPGLDREGLGHFRLKVERLMNRLCDEAESWARSGRRKVSQHIVRRGHVAPLSHTIHVTQKLARPKRAA